MQNKNKYKNEIWKTVEFSDNIRENQHYKVSNYGRIRSFNINKRVGRLIKQVNVNGYKCIGVKQKNNKSTVKYVHILVANAFLDKKEDDIIVIHKDYNKKNNRADNLKWVNKVEHLKHILKKPKKHSNSKLTEKQVRLIKKIVDSPNRKKTYKEIAKEFKISEMQLYRIKRGENWSYLFTDDKNTK